MHKSINPNSPNAAPTNFPSRIVDCDWFVWKARYDALRAENERLGAALANGRALIEDMDLRMPEQATEDEDGFIVSYRIPVGPWHRILGWARGAW